MTRTSSSGISAPTGLTLIEFGLRERCNAARDNTCTDRALEVAGRALAQLGPELPGATDGSASAMIGLMVQVDRDPPWEWRAENGDSGVAPAAFFDLTPFASGEGPAQARIGDATYELPNEAAQALIDALWVQTD